MGSVALALAALLTYKAVDETGARAAAMIKAANNTPATLTPSNFRDSDTANALHGPRN